MLQVLESGTGSGSLTHSLARAVAPAGAVHTFEFHKQRCDEAAAEFKQNGLSDIIHSNHRDIEALGFPESCHGIADGIILDLPAPWKVRHHSRTAHELCSSGANMHHLFPRQQPCYMWSYCAPGSGSPMIPMAATTGDIQVVESAKACLKMNGKFCGFSPCIEQVQRTADALRDADFCDVRCIECILRYHDVRTENYALPTTSTPTATTTAAPSSTTLKRTAAEASVADDDVPAAAAVDTGEGAAQPEQSSGNNGETATAKRPAGGKKGEAQGRVKERRLGRHCGPYVPWVAEHDSVRRTVTLPRHVARGHTGYLLFARKPVKVEESDGSEMDAEEEKGPAKDSDAGGSADVKQAQKDAIAASD